jgi:hypothetical protein
MNWEATLLDCAPSDYCYIKIFFGVVRDIGYLTRKMVTKMSAANVNNSSQFLELCGRPDGREDHDILKYRVDTTSVQRSHSSSLPPTILLVMKGIGKSTAFKILTSEHDEKFLVNGFAPGAERFKSLPLVQPGLYRERFYVMFLLSTISLITEHFDRSGN